MDAHHAPSGSDVFGSERRKSVLPGCRSSRVYKTPFAAPRTGPASHRALPKAPEPDAPPAGTLLLVPCGAVDRGLAGTYAVAEKKLRAKLGHAAFTLWCLLCRVRDPKSGTTRITARELGRYPGWERFPEAVVRKALRRLTEARLVEARARTWKNGGGILRTTRVVRGAPAYLPGQVLLSVPVETAAWVGAASGWGGARKGTGGARKGAGRPAGAKAKKRRGPRSVEALTALEETLTWGGQAPSNAVVSESSSRPVTPPDQSSSGTVRNQQEAPFSKTLKYREEFSSSSKKKRTNPPAAPDGAKSPSDERDATPQTPAPKGTRVGAPRPMAFVDVTGELGVPSLPGAPLVRLPEPPLLVAEDGPDRWAYLLATWYTGAVEAAYGKRCWIFARGPVADSKHVKLLHAAARAFLRHDIAPAAWVAWSISVWRQHKPKDFPPLAWVFGVKRIDERRGWFRDEATEFLAPGVQVPPAWTELRARHAELLRALLAEPALTPETAAEVVDVFLPRSLLNALIERARHQAREAQSDLRERVYCGAWVWTS